MKDWSVDELAHLDAAEEVQLAVARADGTLRREVTIWGVRVGEQVFVRTWYRREGGWFAHVLDSRRARLRAPGAELDVAVEDVGRDDAQPRAEIDAAYRSKYGRYGTATVDRMTSEQAAAATLRLTPVRRARPGGGEAPPR